MLPDVARNEIDAHRLKVLRGNAADPLDGHIMLCRLRVAAALMFLEGQELQAPTIGCWLGEIMAVSSRTRGEIEHVLSDRNRRSRTARPVARGEDDSYRRMDRRTRHCDEVSIPGIAPISTRSFFDWWTWELRQCALMEIDRSTHFVDCAWG